MKTMKTNKILNYLFSIITVVVLTACGSSGNGGSSDCSINIEDSDNDGFLDKYDSAPTDAFKNGKYSSLENVINNLEVKRVLQIAKDAGVIIRTELANNPPNFTGYYKIERAGPTVDSNLEYLIGTYLAPMESRVCMEKGYGEFAISQSSYGSIKTGLKIRGKGKYFTRYHLYTSTYPGCTVYRVHIRSGEVESGSRDMLNVKSMIATLGYTETANGACAQPKAANYWAFSITNVRNKITNLDELEYMCVDGKKAYIPGETWTNSDKESCRCTKDVETECK